MAAGRAAAYQYRLLFAVCRHLGLVGGDTGAKLEWAHERLGGEIGIDDVYEAGKELDVVGITKGKGWQGVIKRFGVKLLSHKNSKRRRQIGNMGDFGTGYVRKTIRQAGQMGYHKRTELNKRILRISNLLQKHNAEKFRLRQVLNGIYSQAKEKWWDLPNVPVPIRRALIEEFG